jgi:uncharacterized membrane-anchored protein
MKVAIFWCATLGVFGVVNAMIASKEAAIRTGETIYLELAPVDRPSLMQGDYMALNYRIHDDVRAAKDIGRRGALVVKKDEQGVARFVRVHQGEPLSPGEHLLRYRRGRFGRVQVGANAFYFQEGRADLYAQARYGEYKVAPTGESILVALRNEDFSRAGPRESGR